MLAFFCLMDAEMEARQSKLLAQPHSYQVAKPELKAFVAVFSASRRLPLTEQHPCFMPLLPPWPWL